MKDFVFRNGWRAILSMSIVGVVVVVAIIGLGLFSTNFDQAAGLAIFTAGQIVLSIIILCIMRGLQILNPADFTLKGKAKGFLLAWLCVVGFLGNSIMQFIGLQGYLVAPDPFHLIIVILHPFIGTGFFEEVLVRGLMLLVLLKVFEQTKKGMMNAVIISSVIFGLAHLANLTHTGALPVVAQVIFASAMGIFFAALYLRTKTLIIPIIVHGFVNLTTQIWGAFIDVGAMPQPYENSGEDTGMVIVMLVVGIIHLVIGLVLMRKVTPNRVVESESCA